MNKPLEELTDEETQRFLDVYMNYCKEHGQQGDLKDFTIWYEEQYGE